MAMRIKHRLNGNEEDDFGLVNVEELNNQIDEFTGRSPWLSFRSR